MRRAFAIAACLAAGLLAPATQAAGRDIRTCSFRYVDGKALARQLIVTQADGAAGYTVLDAIIDRAEGRPIAATVTRDDARRLNLHWTVRVAYRDQEGGRRLSVPTLFNLSVSRATERARIDARALGFSGFWTAAGRCVLAHGAH